MDIIRNSFLFTLLRRFVKTYHAGFFHGAALQCGKLYQTSFCHYIADAWLSKQSRAGRSLYAYLLLLLHRLVCRIGSPIYDKWSASVARLIWLRFSAFCARSVRGSFFLRPFAKALLSIDANRFILLCLGLYFPLDYVIRRIPHLSLLASVWDELLMVFAVLVILFSYSKPHSLAEQSKATPVDAALILFIGVSTFLMLLTTDYPLIALAGYRAVVEYMIWFFIVVRLLRSDTDVKVFLYGLCFTAIMIGLHGIYQYIVAAPMPAQWVAQSEAGVRTRVYSIIGSPNVMGSFLIMTAPLVLAAFYYCKKIWLKLLCLFGTGCLCLSLLFTFSRGAWVGFVLTALIFSLLVDKRLIALMMAGIAGLLFVSSSIASRITFLFTNDFVEASAKGGRALRWEFGYQMLEEHPFFGLGLGRFGGAVAMQNQILDKTDTFEYFYMDNYYLKTAVEMGYIGLAVFLFLLVVLIIWSSRAIYARKNDALSLLSKGAFSGMIGVLVHSYFENIFEVPAMNTYFWALAAIIIYMGFPDRSQDRELRPV